MACWEGKKYKLCKSENFDEYMKELGVGLVLRKVGNSVTPTVELVKDGDNYKLISTSTFKTYTLPFKLCEEFDEETQDGRKVKTIMSMEGDTLMQEQQGEKPSTIIREFSDSELITTLIAGDVKSVRIYKAMK